MANIEMYGNGVVNRGGANSAQAGATADRPATPAVGSLWFGTDTGLWSYYTSSGWINLTQFAQTFSDTITASGGITVPSGETYGGAGSLNIGGGGTFGASVVAHGDGATAFEQLGIPLLGNGAWIGAFWDNGNTYAAVLGEQNDSAYIGFINTGTSTYNNLAANSGVLSVIIGDDGSLATSTGAQFTLSSTGSFSAVTRNVLDDGSGAATITGLLTVSGGLTVGGVVSSLGGQATAGALGAPVVVSYETATVTSSATSGTVESATVISFTTTAAGIYRLNLSANTGGGGTVLGSVSVPSGISAKTYYDSTTGVVEWAWNVTGTYADVGAGYIGWPTYNLGYIATDTTITVTWSNTSNGTAATDTVYAVLERIQ